MRRPPRRVGDGRHLPLHRHSCPHHRHSRPHHRHSRPITVIPAPSPSFPPPSPSFPRKRESTPCGRTSTAVGRCHGHPPTIIRPPPSFRRRPESRTPANRCRPASVHPATSSGRTDAAWLFPSPVCWHLYSLLPRPHYRHSRESGNPHPRPIAMPGATGGLDSGLRRNDGGGGAPTDGRRAAGGGRCPRPGCGTMALDAIRPAPAGEAIVCRCCCFRA